MPITLAQVPTETQEEAFLFAPTLLSIGLAGLSPGRGIDTPAGKTGTGGSEVNNLSTASETPECLP